jgi:hypothetical protein
MICHTETLRDDQSKHARVASGSGRELIITSPPLPPHLHDDNHQQQQQQQQVQQAPIIGIK